MRLLIQLLKQPESERPVYEHIQPQLPALQAAVQADIPAAELAVPAGIQAAVRAVVTVSEPAAEREHDIKDKSADTTPDRVP